MAFQNSKVHRSLSEYWPMPVDRSLRGPTVLNIRGEPLVQELPQYQALLDQKFESKPCCGEVSVRIESWLVQGHAERE
jgi:hypothetical protein